MKKLFFIISAIALIACKNSEKATTNSSNTKQANSQETMQNDKEIFTVSFISKGEGIDRDLKTKFEEGLAKFNADQQLNLTPEKKPWGREGEFNLEFDLKNLSTKQKKAFSSFVKETIGNSDMLQIKN